MNDSRANELASALATVNSMRDELHSCHDTIAQLKADLNAANSRIELLDESRRRYRAESLLFRAKLVELATIQSNIGLIVRRADEITSAVSELMEKAETPTDGVLDAMERELREPTRVPANRYEADSQSQPYPVAPLPEGA